MYQVRTNTNTALHIRHGAAAQQPTHSAHFTFSHHRLSSRLVPSRPVSSSLPFSPHLLRTHSVHTLHILPTYLPACLPTVVANSTIARPPLALTRRSTSRDAFHCGIAVKRCRPCPCRTACQDRPFFCLTSVSSPASRVSPAPASLLPTWLRVQASRVSCPTKTSLTAEPIAPSSPSPYDTMA